MNQVTLLQKEVSGGIVVIAVFKTTLIDNPKKEVATCCVFHTILVELKVRQVAFILILCFLCNMSRT